MAKIFGDYEIHGELYLKSYSHQPYPLLLSTNIEGKVIFTSSVNSITASFPIVIDNQTNVVAISHANSGWIPKDNLSGSSVISNIQVTEKGHIFNWNTRLITSEDIDAEPAFNKGNIIEGNGITIQGNVDDRLVFPGSVIFSHANTSTQSSVLNSNRDVIQSISLDSNFGHVTDISTVNLDNIFDDKYVRYDINNQGLNLTERQSARINIQALSKDTDDSRTGKLTQNGDVDITGELKVINGDILFSTNKRIDTIDSNGVLNIGTSNSDIINIGKIGSTVNIVGDLLYQNVTNLEVTDKLIKINKNGPSGSANNSGFEIEENNIVTGFIKTNGDRDGWLLKVPSKDAVFNLSFDLLTNINRTQEFQNENGIIALVGEGLLDDRYIRNILVGNLNPLFTSATASTTPTETISFTLSNANANTFFGNNTSTAGLPSYNQLEALTKTDDTNITLTLGGTPATALAKPVSMTLGWTGQLAVSRGGTGASSLTGVLIGNGTSPMIAVPGTANQVLRRNSTNNAYEFSLIETDNISNSQVTYNKIQNVTADRLLGRLLNNGVVQELTAPQIRTFLNVSEGATSYTGWLLSANSGTSLNINSGENVDFTASNLSIERNTRTITYGLTGQALALHNLSTNGFIVRTSAGVVTSRTITPGIGISIDNGDGISGNTVVRHISTSTQPSVSNTNGTVIQSISLDTNFGHVTNISSVNLDNRYIQSINLGYTSDIGQGTITNSTGGTNAIIPAATISIAGLITTLTQSIAGAKTFTSAVTAPNFITTSDIRIKSEIKPIENALELISKFISYEYKKDGIKEAGFMAQEIREVIPYTVFENSDGILTMSDRPILAYLHKAILELKEEIEKIKK
jgi:hypothetical protein